MFVHHTAIQGSGFRFLQEGEKVSVRFGPESCPGAPSPLPAGIPPRLRRPRPTPPLGSPQVEFVVQETDRGLQAANVTGPGGAALDRAADERAAPGSDEY